MHYVSVGTYRVNVCCSGHYDILYKLEDLPQRGSVPHAPTQQNVIVALNHASTELTHHKIGFELDNIEIPGMSFYSGPSMAWPAFSQYEFPAVSTTHAISSPPPVEAPIYTALPVAHVQEVYVQTVPVTPPAIAPVTLPHHPAPHAAIDRGGPFRPSIWEYETNFAPATPHPPLCQTAIFRK
jgi:ubiquitin thioesterase protein OTUB1